MKAGDEINEVTAGAIEDANIDRVKVRSSLTCEVKHGVCACCYGRNLATGKLAEHGQAVGIIAAQSIGEPGTQLTMRTFHIGGTASSVFKQPEIKSREGGVVRYEHLRIVDLGDGSHIVLNKNGRVSVHDPETNKEIEDYDVPIGAVISVGDGEKVKKGATFVQWDPYNVPILSEKAGKIVFHDLIEGVTMDYEEDPTTGQNSMVVIEHKEDLHPQIIVEDKKGHAAASYPIPAGAHVQVDEGDSIDPGTLLAKTPRKTSKTKDITGGLPRVAELFEARRPKDHAIIAEIDGYVKFGRDFKNKRRISIVPGDDSLEPVEYMVPKGKHIPVAEGDFVQKGDYIMDGNPAPHDILRIMGIEALADYLIDEVQDVYRLQGVKINDKHIEVIVRQMLQKWEILDSGETTLLKGENVDKAEFDEANEKAIAKGGRPATGEPILLGITKASLQTRSFISAASFQETTRVLTEASVQGKRDKLVGLKENVIVGRLIPAGTGGATQRVRRIAQDRDMKVIEEARAEAEAAAALAAPEAPEDGFAAEE